LVVDVPTRHAVLVSDGRDFSPEVTASDAVVRAARGAGATLSTIAVGFDADLDLLQRLARIGHGRYHAADRPGDLPRLTVEESELLRARSEQTGDFRAEAAGPRPHPALAGVDLAALPPLGGYLAVGRRSGADVVLTTPTGDPLLATWQYGLGRVAAWLSDAGEDWAWDWPDNAAAAMLWARVVGYVAPSPESGPPGVAVTVSGTDAEVMVDAVDSVGRPEDLLDASLSLTESGAGQPVVLGQVAPGRYTAEVVLEPDAAVLGSVRVSAPEGDRTALVVLRVPPSAQVIPDRRVRERLVALADAGGGRVLDARIPTGSRARGRVTLWPWLVGLAALLWPLDIAHQLGPGWSRRRARIRRAPETGREGD